MSVEVVEAALREVFLSYAVLPGTSVDERDDLLSVRTTIPLTFFNGIPRAVLRPDDAEARVQEMIARYREGGVPLRWWITPSSAPGDLVQILERNRFRHFYDAPGMVMELDALPEPKSIPGVSILRVENAPMLWQFVSVVGMGFNQPHEQWFVWYNAFLSLGFRGQWRQYIAYLDGLPVATSAVCLSGELAGIYHVVTLPQARGRGIGAAVTLAALLDARASGCRVTSLQSSLMAVSVYRALGFEKCCELTTYEWRPEYA